ncbi:hypothetical protein F1C58_16250 (plasmid) [Glaciihabitans sp. INWT7]|uniref:hypothetical protein n=1 Tax=Glaciihabitans sp. INWT7 TaxID=2596912 RepID=UPI001623BED9|nr:hypothetical protein [Glaciihabitans sp. INWT7]QNE48611.1 hypothetical protein F1C58_16250 [Glaciihabitans sp. INWT7]
MSPTTPLSPPHPTVVSAEQMDAMDRFVERVGDRIGRSALTAAERAEWAALTGCTPGSSRERDDGHNPATNVALWPGSEW